MLSEFVPKEFPRSNILYGQKELIKDNFWKHAYKDKIFTNILVRRLQNIQELPNIGSSCILGNFVTFYNLLQ